MARKQDHPIQLTDSEREELERIVKTGQYAARVTAGADAAVERQRQNRYGNRPVARSTPFDSGHDPAAVGGRKAPDR